MLITNLIRSSIIASLLLTALLLPSSASASKSQMTVIEDPGRTHSFDPASRAAALNDAKALGANYFKISVHWREFAPDPLSLVKPNINLSDPASYPAGTWDELDELVSGAQARGMQPWLTLTAPAPRWAVSRENGTYVGNYLPDAQAYGEWVEAVGARYRSVKTFSFWNEPNIRRFIDPQTERGVVKSAVHYRQMYSAAYEAMRATGHRSHKLLIGELMPRTPARVDPNTTRPVAFLRAFFCLDGKGKPMKGKTASSHDCKKFKKIATSGLAYHPYRLSGGPLDKDKVSKDNAPINYLARIQRVLDQANKQKRLSARKLQIYNSEFGFQSDPPDIFAGTPISRIPSYLNISEYLSWIDPRVATYSQYLIVDDADLAAFQTGLFFNDGTPKPGVLAAFQTPMVAMTTRSKNRVSIWGGARANTSSRVSIEIQYANGAEWKTAKTVSAKGSHGYFLSSVALANAKSKTWRLVWSGGTSRSSRAITPPKPRKD